MIQGDMNRKYKKKLREMVAKGCQLLRQLKNKVCVWAIRKILMIKVGSNGL